MTLLEPRSSTVSMATMRLRPSWLRNSNKASRFSNTELMRMRSYGPPQSKICVRYPSTLASLLVGPGDRWNRRYLIAITELLLDLGRRLVEQLLLHRDEDEV